MVFLLLVCLHSEPGGLEGPLLFLPEAEVLKLRGVARDTSDTHHLSGNGQFIILNILPCCKRNKLISTHLHILS